MNFKEKVPGKVGETVFDDKTARASRDLRWPWTPANICSLHSHNSAVRTEQQSFEKCFWASQANPGKACLSHTKYFYDVKGFGWDLYNKYWVGDHPEGRILPINWNFHESNSRDSKQQQYVEVSNRLLAQD